MIVFTLADIISLILFGILILGVIIFGLFILYCKATDRYYRKRKERWSKKNE